MDRKCPDPPRRRRPDRPILSAKLPAKKKFPAVIVNTTVSDNLRNGAKEMDEVALYLHRGGFFEDAEYAANIAEGVRNLARRVEGRVAAYGNAIREHDIHDNPGIGIPAKPRHDPV